MMNSKPIKPLQPLTLPHKQQGIALVLAVIGLLIIVAVSGLALDVSHAMLNKSRVQNVVDAAALAGARVLSDTEGNVLSAETEARNVFTANTTASGNRKMIDGISMADVDVEFSATLEPFVVGSTPPEYVRVRVNNFAIPAWLIQVAGINETTLRASAVAGPSPTLGTACDLVPLIICGDPGAGAPLFGYEDDEVHILKASSESGSSSGEIGPGNFQLARLGGSGANTVRNNLAGGFEGCVNLNDNIPTEPGNEVGPVAQGINTRLGVYAGPISPGDYPPDVVTETPTSDISYDDESGNIVFGDTVVTDSSDIDFNYNDYVNRLGNPLSYENPVPVGAFDRRNMAVTIADCSGTNSGATSLPILGFGCFFLLQEVKQKGNEAEMYGEFVAECDAKGVSGPNPVDQPGPFIIQLYNDPDSSDS